MSAALGCESPQPKLDWGRIMPSTAHLGSWRYHDPVEARDASDADKLLKGRALTARSYGLREMARARLAHASRSDLRVIIDVCAFGSAAAGFGYYSLDRARAPRIEIEQALGTQGFSAAGLIEFWRGPYVVRCASSRSRPATWESLMLLANLVLERLPPAPDEWPAELKLFPADGLRPNSERLVRPNVLDQEYLGEGWAAGYAYVGLKYELVLVPAGIPLAAQTRLARLREHLSRFGTVGPSPESLGDEALAGSEAGIGNVIAARAGSWVVMTVNCPDEQEALRKLSAVCGRVVEGAGP